MNRIDFDRVQSTIDYSFKNPKLLEQAFTRKSYSEEHPGIRDNEVLEFYGDEVLDFFVTKSLYKKFSKIEDGEFASEKDEGELTRLKSMLVSKQTLARCVYNAGFSELLYMGNSDVKNEVWKSDSVNEDLFEAIVGAVAVDCSWDFSVLEKVCETMLILETDNSYVSVLLMEKAKKLGAVITFHPRSWQINTIKDFMHENFYHANFGIPKGCTSKNPATGIHEFEVQVNAHMFLGYGDGIVQAKLDAEKKAYHFLCQEEINQQFSNIDYDNPVSTLHELAQKNIIMNVWYEFTEYHDEDGNPIWNCKAILEGYGSFSADNASKKKVKQEAASYLLRYIVMDTIERKKVFNHGAK